MYLFMYVYVYHITFSLERLVYAEGWVIAIVLIW